MALVGFCNFCFLSKVILAGVHHEEQVQALQDMEHLMQNTFFYSTRGTKFQKGILVSIKATLELYSELKSENICFLLTSRVNQDALENFFSQVRYMGAVILTQHLLSLWTDWENCVSSKMWCWPQKVLMLKFQMR